MDWLDTHERPLAPALNQSVQKFQFLMGHLQAGGLSNSAARYCVQRAFHDRKVFTMATHCHREVLVELPTATRDYQAEVHCQNTWAVQRLMGHADLTMLRRYLA